MYNRSTMMDRYIDMLEGPEPERLSQDPATQPANAAAGPQPYNAVSADHLHDCTLTVERHTIKYASYQLPEWNDFEQLREEREPLQERVSPPSYETEPGPHGPVVANTEWSNLRPQLPTDLEDWADISLYAYIQYLPDILLWNPPPFITKQHHWTTIQETGDEAATFESLPALPEPAKRRGETTPPHMPLRPIPLRHTPMPLSAYAPLPPPVHTYYPFQYPPEAHTPHMPVYPPAYMPPNPPAYIPLNPPPAHGSAPPGGSARVSLGDITGK